MSRPVTFVLNTEIVTLDVPTGRPLLDAIRIDAGLKGTKHACREGDCGSCVVLVGEPDDGTVRYRAMNSCLMPVAAAAGCHVITIEGLDPGAIGPLQQPFVDEGASQCGFCTPGFLVSLVGHLLNCPTWDGAPAFNSLAGNICRCTGYASIQRATSEMLAELTDRVAVGRAPFRRPGPRGFSSGRAARGPLADAGSRAAAPMTTGMTVRWPEAPISMSSGPTTTPTLTFLWFVPRGAGSGWMATRSFSRPTPPPRT